MPDTTKEVKNLISAANELAKKIVFKDAEEQIENPFDAVGDMSILDESAKEVEVLLEQTLSDEEVNGIIAGMDGDTHDKQEVAEWANVTVEILKMARSKFFAV